MKRYLFFLVACLFSSIACTQQPSVITEPIVYKKFEYPFIQTNGKTLADFIPPLWVVAGTMYEDLNSDGKTDVLLLLTHTDTNDTTYVFDDEENVMNYYPIKQRILLVLYKNTEGYRLNTYCYKLLNPQEPWGSKLSFDLDPGTIHMIFSWSSNGLYELHYTFKPEIKTGRWMLTKTEENGGNANFETKASYNLINDSLHYNSLMWSRAEDDSTWTESSSDLDTIVHMQIKYYLDSIEDGVLVPSELMSNDPIYIEK